MNRARAVGSLTLAACVLSGITCDSPMGPQGMGERVEVGSTISGTATPPATARYSFVAGNDGEYAVFLAASAGTVQLDVVDSVHSQLKGFVIAGPTTGALLTNATQNFQARLGTVFNLTVTAFQTSASFEFQVFAVHSAPEQQPSQFVIGDTVQGEELSPLVDVDNFTAHGQAGEEIVLVVQPLGPSGAGPLSIVVSDSTSGFLGYSANDAGNPSPHTSGLFTLPTTKDYPFQVRAFSNGVDPRFAGPYRFWSYAINRAPEHRPAALTLGAVVTGEKIDRAGDIDEFSFQATAGQQYDAFVQSARAVRLEVAPVSGLPFAAALSSPADTALFSTGTGRFTMPQGGAYLVRASGTASYDQADTGAYRFLLYAIDPHPEHIAATIVPGDTISGESIDVPGDVDEFSVPGVPGDEDNVFFQALNGLSSAPLQLEVVNDSGRVLNSVLSSVADTGLTHQFTGRFVIPASGSLRLRVTGANSTAARDTGAYRLSLYRVNRKPEHTSDTLVFGDSVLGERIDLAGDIDEFQVTVPDSSGANLMIQLDSTASAVPLVVSLLDSTGHAAPQLFTWNPGELMQTSTFPIGPGKYTLQVNAYDDHSGVVGGYRVWLYKFKFGPEIAPDTIAIGDTISSEALDPPGDVDQFAFFGKAGDHLSVAFQGLGLPGNGGFMAMITGPADPPIWFFYCPMQSDSLGACQSNRLDLNRTGWYRLAITGASSPTQPSEVGPYRVALTRWNTAPEHVGSALSPGDSVTAEALDYLWDWDEFTITGSPGQTLAVISRTPSGTGSSYVLVFDSTTGDTLAKGYPQSFDTPTPRFTLPANGHAELAVYSTGFVGAYQFTVVPVNPAPENVPATFTVGDTVRGEAIFPATDLDEFSATAAPGATLEPWYRLTANPVPAGGLITLQIIDPATGAVLAGSGMSLFAASPTFATPGQFTVPASGQFVVRMRAYYDNDMSTAPYEFYVATVP
jgi:hypothetical protein